MRFRSFYLRREAIATLVRLDGGEIRVKLTAKPSIGTTLDVGFPVVVTRFKDVAGGGLLVDAERVASEGGSTPNRRMGDR